MAVKATSFETHGKDISGVRRQSDVVEYDRHIEAVRQGQVTDYGMERGIADTEQSLGLLVREGARRGKREEYEIYWYSGTPLLWTHWDLVKCPV